MSDCSVSTRYTILTVLYNHLYIYGARLDCADIHSIRKVQLSIVSRKNVVKCYHMTARQRALCGRKAGSEHR